MQSVPIFVISAKVKLISLFFSTFLNNFLFSATRLMTLPVLSTSASTILPKFIPVFTLIISLRRALLKIKEREKDILLQRFMFGKTQMEIADEMGISQAQVSRLEKSAIINVRKLIK